MGRRDGFLGGGRVFLLEKEGILVARGEVPMGRGMPFLPGQYLDMGGGGVS